ncbi:MAG: hypothetical protein JJ900_15575 [Rhodospirillales bacterium]|nr:hypothetical protein [Rhodospirillales bacterium]MBO6788269.1 hypothetical protein [Rhodospirillales bacterium]
MDILTTIASSEPAMLLRGSFWIYPLVNAAHILGIALLIGAIVPFDLRLMGLIRKGRIRTLAQVLVPTAAAGLAIAAASGALLFIVKPVEYARADLFVYKLAVIGIGLINIGWVRSNPRWAELVQKDESILNPSEPNRKLRIAGGVSIAAWVLVLILGRLTGYFM